MNIFVNGIGGSGPRSGKDTVAQLGCEYIASLKGKHTAVQMNLADALKEDYSAKHNIPLDDLYDAVTKEIHRPGLISYGAEMRRKDRSYWPKRLSMKFLDFIISLPDLNDSVSVFVPDIRYPQETLLAVWIAMGMRELGLSGFHVHLNTLFVDTNEEILRQRICAKDDAAFHKILYDASETCLGPDDFGDVVFNNCRMLDLVHACNKLFDKWFKRVK